MGYYYDRPAKICLPLDIYANDAYGIFSLFFTKEVLGIIVQDTNKYGSRRSKDLKAPWKDMSVAELREFLGILIYRSLFPSPHHQDYWNLDMMKPIHTGLMYTMGRNRFLQLEANLHMSDPDIEGNIFSKLKPVNTMLQDTCKTLWKPSSSLAVDECMSRFTGRAKEKLTIVSKPIPTGIKGWVIADDGFFCSWVWHAKGDGPQGIGTIPKPLGRNKTAAVVWYLLNTLPKGPRGTYGVTLDNLFTSTKLYSFLSDNGFGARGTARTNAGIHQELLDHKKSDKNDIIPWGIKHLKWVADGKITQLGWKDSCYCLFMSNMDSGVNTVMTKRRRPNETATCAKTARKPFGDQAEKILPRPALTYHYNMEMNQIDRGDQMRAYYPIQQRQLKGWKSIFYTIINIVVVNSFLISSYATVPKEDKIMIHAVFREKLYTGLFEHATGAAGASGVDIASLPITELNYAAIPSALPPGDSIPRVEVTEQDTEGAATKNTTRTAYKAGEILMAAAPKVIHSRIQMKRGPCAVCKQIAAEKRRGISVGGKKGRVLRESSPNIATGHKDRHVNRAKTGCSACKVLLCTTKGCWEAFHRDKV